MWWKLHLPLYQQIISHLQDTSCIFCALILQNLHCHPVLPEKLDSSPYILCSWTVFHTILGLRKVRPPFAFAWATSYTNLSCCSSPTFITFAFLLYPCLTPPTWSKGSYCNSSWYLRPCSFQPHSVQQSLQQSCSLAALWWPLCLQYLELSCYT